MKKMFIAAFIVSSLSFSGVAGADTEYGRQSINPYSDCGIGAAIFPETHWAAATSNVIWDYGTTAVTSATMSKETCNGKGYAAAIFIKETQVSLSEETAKGEGVHLTSVLNILGCDASNHSAAIAATRESMSNRIKLKSYAIYSDIQRASYFYQDITNAVSKTCSA